MKYNKYMGVFSPENERPHIVEELVIAFVVVGLGMVALGIIFIK